MCFAVIEVIAAKQIMEFRGNFVRTYYWKQERHAPGWLSCRIVYLWLATLYLSYYKVSRQPCSQLSSGCLLNSFLSSSYISHAQQEQLLLGFAPHSVTRWANNARNGRIWLLNSVARSCKIQKIQIRRQIECPTVQYAVFKIFRTLNTEIPWVEYFHR